MNPITEAERKIGAILQHLETETGEVVERVSLENIEVTQMEDTRSIFLRRVLITTYRNPGSNWST